MSSPANIRVWRSSRTGSTSALHAVTADPGWRGHSDAPAVGFGTPTGATPGSRFVARLQAFRKRTRLWLPVLLLLSVGDTAAQATICDDVGLTVLADDGSGLRTAEFGIFRTLAPSIEITLPIPSSSSFSVIVDDGDDSTDDGLDISSLFGVTGSVAHAVVPETVPVGTLPGINQASFRTFPNDPGTIRIFYFGENRIAFDEPGAVTCDTYMLNYAAEDETVVGVDDGIEAHPIVSDLEIATNHIILDFDEAVVTESQISDLLRLERLRPQGITRDLAVIQTRPLIPLGAASLLSRIASISGAGHPDLQEVRADFVITPDAAVGENYPAAMQNDFQLASSDWNADAREHQYHHFIMQTFPAHRLIDMTKSGNIRVYMSGTGVGNHHNFSGSPNEGNQFFVRGSRIKQPVLIFDSIQTRIVQTWPSPVTAHMSDGDLSEIADVPVKPLRGSHDSLVFGILGGDGIGNLGEAANGSNVVLGTGKDAEIRVVRYTAKTELAGYAQLDLSARDPESKIHMSMMSRPSGSNIAPQFGANLISRYRRIADSGKLIIGGAHNQGADPADANRPGLGQVATAEIGLIAPDRRVPRSHNIGSSSYKQRVIVVGSSRRVLTPNELESKVASSNTGPQVSVVAPGDRIRGTARDGTLENQTGTSFATPSVAGIAAELMLVDPDLQQADQLPKVWELIEATADDIEAPGRDDRTGFGRVNFWKAVLSAANRGLSSEGRTAENGKDDFFTFLDLKGAETTLWYGFDIRVPNKNSEIWFRKNDGSYERVEDPGAARPALDPFGGPATPGIVNFMSTQARRCPACTSLRPSLPFSKMELATEQLEWWYLARFSVMKADLEDKTHLLVVKAGATPTTTAEGQINVLSLPLDLAEMRKGPASTDPRIKERVQEFDDFVFHISCKGAKHDGCPADFGDADGSAHPSERASNGARHHTPDYEWLGQPVSADPALRVSEELDADGERDEDGVANLRPEISSWDLDRFDNGVVFHPLTFEPGGRGKATFTVCIKVDPSDGLRYDELNPDKMLYLNAWIDWNTNSDWEEANDEHVIDGLRLAPTAGFDWEPLGVRNGNAVVVLTGTMPSGESGDCGFYQAEFDVGATLGTGNLWARFRLDYGEDVGRNDPRPEFFSDDTLRGVTLEDGTPQPAGQGKGFTQGAARFGEVEDYLLGTDFGDAPDPFTGANQYPTRKDANGGRHLDFNREWLGPVFAYASATRELDACDTTAAEQDGLPNLGQACNSENKDLKEDGLVLPGIVIPSQQFLVEIAVTAKVDGFGFSNTGPLGESSAGVQTLKGNCTLGPIPDQVDTPTIHRDRGRYAAWDPKRRLYLNAWADWNANGIWEAGEKVISGPLDPEDWGDDSSYTLGEAFVDSDANGIRTVDEVYTDIAGVNSRLVSCPVTVPADVALDQSFYWRFRLDYGENATTDSPHPVSGATVGHHATETERVLDQALGGALWGEVEDHLMIASDIEGIFDSVLGGLVETGPVDTSPFPGTGPYSFSVGAPGAYTVEGQPNGSLPPGMLLDPVTGAVVGVSQVLGVHVVVIEVRDASQTLVGLLQWKFRALGAVPSVSPIGLWILALLLAGAATRFRCARSSAPSEDGIESTRNS